MSLLRSHETRFHEYAAPFLRDGDDNVTLKLEHTVRVLDNAREICDAHALSGELRDAALLGALYHDIGRFPQYRDYKTFRDKDSANHALLGIGALHRGRMLNDLSAPLRRLVLAAVALHNVRTLPKNTPPHMRTVISVVRDADKLDIFPVILEHLENPDRESGVVLMNMKRDPQAYTEELLEQIMTGQMGDYALMNWTNDFAILLAGWVHDLNFAHTCRQLLERDLLGRLFATLPETGPIERLRASIMEEVMRRCEYNTVANTSESG